jgi:nitroreductase
MELSELIKKNRSYRRFNQAHVIDSKILVDLVDLARMSASGANRQPLKFMIINTPKNCEKVFPSTMWAGYLKDWDGPVEGERPTAYIIILGDKTVTEGFGVDHGIAAQSIMLGAAEQGLGGCIIGSIRKDNLRKSLRIDDRYAILLVLAIGEPIETVVVEEVKDGNIKYWRDKNGVHHVPKRSLNDLIIND